ncbi:MAG TPA: tetratricopeptide repeat protein, partial [Stellaceae bacterium]|nr:tetratricopeptide repeat protein [Stellaceae bacterium]
MARGRHGTGNRAPAAFAAGRVGPRAAQEFARGVAAQRQARFSEAAAAYRRAIALKPDLSEAYFNLGVVLTLLQRPQEAVAAYRGALPLMRGYPQLHYNLGIVLRQVGERDAAIECYRLAISLKPDYPTAYANLGALLKESGRPEEAEAAFRQACAMAPAMPEAWNNLGLVLHDLGRLEEAVAAFRQATGLRADFADAHRNLGAALKALGARAAAIAAYRAALAANPDHAAACNDLGTVLLDVGDLAAAEAAFRHAIAVQPAEADAHCNLGLVLQTAGRLDEAAATYRQALALRPDFLEALGGLVHVRRKLCDWRDAAQEAEDSRRLVRSGKAGQEPLAFLCLDSSLSEQLACAASWTATRTRGVARLPPRTDRAARDRIRLGYLSADFRQHALAVLAAELFERHDRARFEVVAYSLSADDGSAVRRRLEGAFERFVDLVEVPHDAAARQIRADGIDILVDLLGHTRGARLPILAARPAPIQVNFLGYAGTMGADFIDYVIADATTVPMREQPFYAEHIVHLPDCYMPFDATLEAASTAPSRAELGLPQAGFVFCCFNGAHKIAPATFDIWMRLLRSVPGSVLWLVEDNASARANLRREAEVRGVGADRLVFAPFLPLPEHLARHRRADLFLDTLPYNACTTTALALWAGLPVLT